MILLQSLNIDAESFSKINVLLKHAQFHQEKYGDTFFDFLSEHYFEDQYQANNNHKEHEKLPFKHDSQTCSHLNTHFTLNPIIFEIENDDVLEAISYFIYKESSSSFEKHAVFQPPKSA
ncbi:hypothetical protein SAMN05216503_0160 [Polaribacter sp. KT25b]|nr:hypothetical protein SAMN05216503_0160 [Polaribacter sp. KT25b]